MHENLILSLETSIKQVMIFEKVERSHSYHAAEIHTDDLAQGILDKRISKNISDYCETNVGVFVLICRC